MASATGGVQVLGANHSEGVSPRVGLTQAVVGSGTSHVHIGGCPLS